MMNRGEKMKQNIYDNEQFFMGYEAIRKREYNYNNLLEQPNFLKLVPDLAEKNVLDLGCGMGDFAYSCVTKGAKNVLGIDISTKMITVAKKRYQHEQIQFQKTALEDMKLESGHFDFISSSLAFHYVADFDALIEKISLALCDEGVLLFSIEHPIVTANKGGVDWQFDEEGSLLHFAVDRYQEQGIRTQNWLVNDVVTYHRTFSTIINTLIEHDLQIERVIEPTPTNEALENAPNLQKEFRRPSFLIIQARKKELSVEK